ncbi:hypothetical protein SRRS_21430 [Sporomusa rhizae]
MAGIWAANLSFKVAFMRSSTSRKQKDNLSINELSVVFLLVIQSFTIVERKTNNNDNNGK